MSPGVETPPLNFSENENCPDKTTTLKVVVSCKLGRDSRKLRRGGIFLSLLFALCKVHAVHAPHQSYYPLLIVCALTRLELALALVCGTFYFQSSLRENWFAHFAVRISPRAFYNINTLMAGLYTSMFPSYILLEQVLLLELVR